MAASSSGPGRDDPAPSGSTDPAGPDPADTDPADTDPADTDPAATDPADTGGSAKRVPAALKKPPIPSSAFEISLGTIQTLFASPWAICGSICMYW